MTDEYFRDTVQRIQQGYRAVDFLDGVLRQVALDAAREQALDNCLSCGLVRDDELYGKPTSGAEAALSCITAIHNTWLHAHGEPLEVK